MLLARIRDRHNEAIDDLRLMVTPTATHEPDEYRILLSGIQSLNLAPTSHDLHRRGATTLQLKRRLNLAFAPEPVPKAGARGSIAVEHALSSRQLCRAFHETELLDELALIHRSLRSSTGEVQEKHDLGYPP